MVVIIDAAMMVRARLSEGTGTIVFDNVSREDMALDPLEGVFEHAATASSSRQY